ncbi:MAG: nucleotide sugar dehydrogenase [Thaumarchaeota archaeon]|nr:nucleotide sugar dehydrogenase [Nitrososphaerota archaeon]
MPKANVHRISVVGLGKLGLCLAATLAEAGFQVQGVEVDESKVSAINRGVSPVYEPGLDELIKNNSKRLRATSRYEGTISSTDATFVVVPTPSDKSGAFSLEFVNRAMSEIGRELADKKCYHLVVLTSTVMPGSMDGFVRPILEKTSGKVCGKDFGLCYNPEFIALGDVIRGMLEPDLVLIGESDAKAGELLSRIQDTICTNSPPIERMEFVNAELAKISLNSFVTMKMSFANTLAEISEKMPGGDVDKITKAIGRDKRVGPAYLRGATGYGGPCFPRDNIAFAHQASKIGAQALLAEATHKVNLSQVQRIVGLAEGIARKPTDRVGVLGLSYKPMTNVVEQSQSLMIAKRLGEGGYKVSVFDPAAMEGAKQVLGDSVQYASSAEDCVRSSDLVVLATPWPEFQKLNARLFKGKAVLDCWRFFGEQVRNVSSYTSVGIAKEPGA